jgi:hypothetical protein
MDLSDTNFKLGRKALSELPNSERCLTELRKIQRYLSNRFKDRHLEFFDFGFHLALDAEQNVEQKLARLTQACIWHSIALKSEFQLKLLYTIDGYLSAVAEKNPVSIFLMARYLLELVATISAIDFQLTDCLKISSTNWERRGLQFFALLYQARYSTSDEKQRLVLIKHGIPDSVLRPIRINKAIKQLCSRPGFDAARSAYSFLSNICHHNGSGHIMFTESATETNAIVLPSGKPVFLKEKTAAITITYPCRSRKFHPSGIAW